MARIETVCDMEFWQSAGCQFFKGSRSARKSLKFCKNVAAVWTFFKKLLLIVKLQLFKFLLHKFRDQFREFITAVLVSLRVEDVLLLLLIQGIPCLSQSVWQMIQGRIFPALQCFPLHDGICHEFPCFFSANLANLRGPSTP